MRFTDGAAVKTGQCLNKVNVRRMNYLLGEAEGLAPCCPQWPGARCCVPLPVRCDHAAQMSVKDGAAHPGTGAGR